MNSKELLEAAIALRARIAELPGGYVSRKTINGKERFYLQWREDGKLKSKYLKAGEKERIEPLIEERKAIAPTQAERPFTMPSPPFRPRPLSKPTS